MIKHIVIDALDIGAQFAKWASAKCLRISRWLADAAESVETGDSISDIRKQRENDQ